MSQTICRHGNKVENMRLAEEKRKRRREKRRKLMLRYSETIPLLSEPMGDVTITLPSFGEQTGKRLVIT